MGVSRDGSVGGLWTGAGVPVGARCQSVFLTPALAARPAPRRRAAKQRATEQVTAQPEQGGRNRVRTRASGSRDHWLGIGHLGRTVRHRLRASCLAQLAGRFHERRDDQAVQRQVTVVIALPGAELDAFRCPAGDVERAEHPVPERQVDREVLVEVPGRIAVVDLVLGRAVQHMLHHRPERQPHMAVPQVHRQRIEDEDQVGHAEQRVAADLPTAGVPEGAGIGTQGDDPGQLPGELLHEVNAAGRRWHQHRRRVMHLVEGPQPAGVEGPVHPVVLEIAHQENPKPIEQGEAEVLTHLWARAPELGEEGHVIAGSQDVRIDQPDDGHHQRRLPDAPHEVVLVIQQGRTMEMHPVATDELPERPRIRQPTVLPEAEHRIGDCIGEEEKQRTDAAVQIEKTGETVDDRIEYQGGQVAMERQEIIHGRRVFGEGPGAGDRSRPRGVAPSAIRCAQSTLRLMNFIVASGCHGEAAGWKKSMDCLLFLGWPGLNVHAMHRTQCGCNGNWE